MYYILKYVYISNLILIFLDYIKMLPVVYEHYVVTRY